MDRNQSGDEGDTMEKQKGEQADRRANASQNQSSVSEANKPSHCPLGQQRKGRTGRGVYLGTQYPSLPYHILLVRLRHQSCSLNK